MTGKHAMGWTPGRRMAHGDTDLVRKRRAGNLFAASSLAELVSNGKRSRASKNGRVYATSGGANIVKWETAKNASERIASMNKRGALDKVEFFIAGRIIQTLSKNPGAKFADIEHVIYREVKASGLRHVSFPSRANTRKHKVERVPGLSAVGNVMKKLSSAGIVSLSRGAEALKSAKK